MLKMAIAGCLIVIAVHAQAALIQYDGAFSASKPDFAIPTISGSFSFVFDDSVVGTSNNGVYTAELTSLTIFPDPYAGAFSFTPADTGVILTYGNEDLFQIIVGGLLNQVNQVNEFTNDFFVAFILTNAPIVAWADANSVTSDLVEGTGSYTTTDVTVTPVPEPDTISLFGMGLLGLAALRRRRTSL